MISFSFSNILNIWNLTNQRSRDIWIRHRKLFIQTIKQTIKRTCNKQTCEQANMRTHKQTYNLIAMSCNWTYRRTVPWISCILWYSYIGRIQPSSCTRGYRMVSSHTRQYLWSKGNNREMWSKGNNREMWRRGITVN